VSQALFLFASGPIKEHLFMSIKRTAIGNCHEHEQFRFVASRLSDVLQSSGTLLYQMLEFGPEVRLCSVA
jgi:hypothetical protein